MAARRFGSLEQFSQFSAADIVYLYPYPGPVLEIVNDRGSRIEWIGIIMKQIILNREYSFRISIICYKVQPCHLYTSDAADDLL